MDHIRVGEFFTLIVGAIREHTPNEIIRRKIAKELWKTGLISHHEYGGIRNNILNSSRSDAYFRRENIRVRRYKFNNQKNKKTIEDLKVIEALIPILGRRCSDKFKTIISMEWNRKLPATWFPKDKEEIKSKEPTVH